MAPSSPRSSCRRAPHGVTRSPSSRLRGGPISKEVALHGVSWILEPGHSLELEATTGSTQYAFGRMGPFEIEFEATPTIPIAAARFAVPVRRAK